MPDKNFKPLIILLYCEQSLTSDKKLLEEAELNSWFNVKFEVLPCSSKIEVSHLLKILECGKADGIEVVGCAKNQCRYLTGKNITEKRIDYARNLLEQIKMGTDRLGMSRADGLSGKELIGIAEKRAKAVMPLGSNPMKE